MIPTALKDHVFYQGKRRRPPTLHVNEEWVAIDVSRWWNLKPWEYRALLPEKIAELRAAFDVHRLIERYQYTEEERIMDEEERNRNIQNK